MRCSSLLCLGGLFLLTASAWASRAVTDDERAKLVAAVSTQGCTGGSKMVWDDPKYEVDDVRCSDGRMYDLSFDRDFKLINKKPN